MEGRASTKSNPNLASQCALKDLGGLQRYEFITALQSALKLYQRDICNVIPSDYFGDSDQKEVHMGSTAYICSSKRPPDAYLQVSATTYNAQDTRKFEILRKLQVTIKNGQSSIFTV